MFDQLCAQHILPGGNDSIVAMQQFLVVRLPVDRDFSLDRLNSLVMISGFGAAATLFAKAGGCE